MQGENLKAIIRICNQKECRDFDESDFPLAVGITTENDFIFGNDAKLCPAVWFDLADDQIFFSPVEGYSIKLNGKKLDDSTWLGNNDRIEINSGLMTVSIDAGVTVLSYEAPKKAPELKPPDTPARKETHHTEDNESKSGNFTPETSDELPDPGQVIESPESGNVPVILPLPKAKKRSLLQKVLFFIFVLLLFGALFIITAVPVTIEFTPVPDTVSMSRFPLSIKVGKRYLSAPGSYKIAANKEGYKDFEKIVKIQYGKEELFQYKLIKLPGLLSVKTDPVEGAAVRIDGNLIGKTPLSSVEVEAGPHELSITTERYLPVKRMIEIRGKGSAQTMDFTLEPGWGFLKIKSRPEGAEVWLNGVMAGVTPLEAEPMKGAYRLELKKEDWVPVSENINIEPGQVIEMSRINLQKVKGMFKLTSNPSGASVMIDNEFCGNTPISVAITPEKDHEFSLTKNGFKQASGKFRVARGETKIINVSLKQEYGTIFITSEPVDAKLKVDGKEIGNASRRLRLTALPHMIEVSKAGYEPYYEKVTPEAGLSKKLSVLLNKLPDDIKTSEGQLLIKIEINRPVQFQMGSSRREPGRRSNETQYQVELTRTFFISEHEVTNGEFNKFCKDHNSGDVNGISLNKKNQPVSSITWDDAAAYLNWLSKKDGLSPAYIEENGKMVAIMPMTNGYRLPTEAEWAFIARYQGRVSSLDSPIKYPWGNGRYPQKKCGNYADSSAENILPLTIKDYTDGYAVSAPVGQFPSNALGIFDLGGNVSEWCHDFYDIRVGINKNIFKDPTGPASGKYHVVRGSSWRHGSVTELRLTYRDYTNKGRNDIGFRIARYEEIKKQNH